MQLTDEQTQKVKTWIEEGEKLSGIQVRLGEEFGIRLTYMDARLLVDDLKLTPKDPEVIKPVVPEEPAADGTAPTSELAADSTGLLPGKVTVVVDVVTRPGSVVSGGVTFSDGTKTEWYMDQAGRLGLVPPSPGYRPPDQDIEEFQQLLNAELQRMGM